MARSGGGIVDVFAALAVGAGAWFLFSRFAATDSKIIYDVEEPAAGSAVPSPEIVPASPFPGLFP